MAKDNLFGERGCSPLPRFLANNSPPGCAPGVKAAADLMTYCDAHACEIPHHPVPTSENPFRERNSSVLSSELPCSSSQLFTFSLSRALPYLCQ